MCRAFLGLGEEGVIRLSGALVEDVDDAEKPFSARETRSRSRRAEADSNLMSGGIVIRLSMHC